MGGMDDWRENPAGNDPSVFVYVFPYDDMGYFVTSWHRQHGLIEEGT